MNPVIHFEIPYNDARRVAKFYTSAFGWDTKDLGDSMGHYVLATTTETDQNGPKTPGAINGGFFAKNGEKPLQYPSVVIAVDEVKSAIEKVNQAGGKVLGEPMDIPGVGKYVSFTDTEGNRVGMLQPLRRPS